MGLGDRSLLTEALTSQLEQDLKQPFDLRKWLDEGKRRVPELYRKHVSQELRQEQEPELFDFARRRASATNN